MKSSCGIFAIALLCLLSIENTTCETTKQLYNEHVYTENLKDVGKTVNIDIKNNAEGIKISLPTGEIYVPSQRKNIHIKTIDVFEEKNPMTQPEFDKYDETSLEDKDSEEDDQIARSKKPALQDNPPPFYYVPNYQQLGSYAPHQNPYQFPINGDSYYPPKKFYPYQQPQDPYQLNNPYPYPYPIYNTPEVHKPVVNNPFFNYFNSKKTEMNQTVNKEEVDALRNRFTMIARSFLTLVSTFFNITLHPVIFQLISLISRYLYP